MMAEPIRKLIHDIKSKCSSLRDAADLLPETSNGEKLELMEAQARSLAQVLSDERQRCQRGEDEVSDARHRIQEKLEKYYKIGENINVRRFARFVLGEGLEKRQDNLAAEIAKLAK